MSLTTAQSATLLAAIKADPTGNSLRVVSDDKNLAVYLNTVPASPVMVWRPSISQTEINTAIVGTEFAALSSLKQNLLNVMLTGPVDATSANVQANFTAIFGAGTTLANLTTLAKRNATRLEQVFVTNGVSAVFGLVIQAADVASVVRNDDGSLK